MLSFCFHTELGRVKGDAVGEVQSADLSFSQAADVIAALLHRCIAASLQPSVASVCRSLKVWGMRLWGSGAADSAPEKGGREGTLPLGAESISGSWPRLCIA